MRPLDAVRVVLCLIAVIALGACTGFGSKKVDYKSASQLPPLDVPPDLTRPGGADDRYTIPDINSKGSTTFSEYNRDRATQRAGSGAAGVLPQQDDVRIVRDGSQRWLVVKGTPDQVWPVVKAFWQESGLIVNIEVPEAGVMETDWAEKRAKIDGGPLRNFLSWALDSVYSTSERDKYRTRLERGAQPGTTEIYISHRGMEEVYTQYTSGDRADTRWQPRPPDPLLEAEMLGRLMVRFGVDAPRAKALVASPTAIPLRAKLASGPDGANLLALDEQFDRAWRRVGLALDRVGFTVEDRDRSKGLYFVRYIDPQIDNKSADDKGFFSWLTSWGSSDKAKQEQFRIEVKDAAQGCQVKVLGKDGAQETSQTAGRILSLLYDQLK